MIAPKLFFSLFFLAPLMVWAHGEDLPGPHGGNIRMPGAFHTEVVPDKDQSLHIYLLDMNFKNATTKDSSLKVQARQGKKTVDFKCATMGDHFHCIPSQKYSPQGEILVQATREKAVGNEAIYKLPLKYTGNPKTETPAPPSGHHHGHH